MRASNEVAAYLIFECLEENLVEPRNNWPTLIFEDRSYARWAATEIAEMLMDRPYDDPDLIVQEFMLKMMALENTTRDPAKKRIFNIAIETAEDILTLF